MCTRSVCHFDGVVSPCMAGLRDCWTVRQQRHASPLHAWRTCTMEMHTAPKAHTPARAMTPGVSSMFSFIYRVQRTQRPASLLAEGALTGQHVVGDIMGRIYGIKVRMVLILSCSEHHGCRFWQLQPCMPCCRVLRYFGSAQTQHIGVKPIITQSFSDVGPWALLSQAI